MNSVPPIPAVQTFGLTRMYGNIAALSGMDLTVNKGDLFGFIGSNGAGKTTTLRILATFLVPSAGRAEVLGHDVVRDADAVRHIIGYMPDFFAFTRTWKLPSTSISLAPVTRFPRPSARKLLTTCLNWSA